MSSKDDGDGGSSRTRCTESLRGIIGIDTKA